MNFENYEGTAIDTSAFEDVQPNVEPTTEPTDNPKDESVLDATIVSETTPAPEPDKPTKFSIDGLGEFTADEVKEWKNGNLRQSDYTKKTQELARQREQLKDADELYNYLKTNPHIVEAMKQAESNPNSPAVAQAPSAERELLQQLASEQRALKTDLQLNALKEKYGDVDELALFTKANELHTDDLEFVYKAIAYDKSSVDKQALIDEAKKQLKAELEKDKGMVSTVVTTKQQQAPPEPPSLSGEEARVAAKMGLSTEEYLKWRG